MSAQDLGERSDLDVEATVTWLHQAGLAGPAYLLLQSMRPLSFLGGQSLLFLQPFLPLERWRSVVGRFAGLLADRSRLDDLVGSLEARLRGPKGRSGKENS